MMWLCDLIVNTLIVTFGHYGVVYGKKVRDELCFGVPWSQSFCADVIKA